AIATASAIGLPWGLVAGYAGGKADLALMRVADALLVLPGLVIALAITTALGANLTNAMLAVGIVFSPIVARVLRSGVLTVRDREYVMVTRLYGLPPHHRMLHHVLPNALAPALVQITLLAGISATAPRPDPDGGPRPTGVRGIQQRIGVGHQTPDETASYYRERRIAAVIWGVDPRARNGVRPGAVHNDELLEAAERNNDV